MLPKKSKRRVPGQSDFIHFVLAFCNSQSIADMVVIVGVLGIVIITLQYRSLFYGGMLSVYNKASFQPLSLKNSLQDHHVKKEHDVLVTQTLTRQNMPLRHESFDKSSSFSNNSSLNNTLSNLLQFSNTSTYIKGQKITTESNYSTEYKLSESENRTSYKDTSEAFYEVELEESLIPNYNVTQSSNINMTFEELHRPQTAFPQNVSAASKKKRKIRIKLYKKTLDPDEEKYKEDSKTFSHPLNINLKLLVEQKINLGKDMPYKPINTRLFSYIVPPPTCNFCKHSNLDSHVKYTVILVKSSVHHFNIRKALRQVWKKQGPKDMKMVFLLGDNQRYRHLVKSESQKNHDVIQQNFYDAYMNNTFKTVMAFDWAVKYCSKATYLIFIDDDFYVLYDQLNDYVHQFPTDNLLRGALVVDPIPYRDKFYKWYVSREDYAPNLYPDYLSGGVFVTSMSVAEKFHLAFPYVKYFGVDDAYLGIVAYKLGIIPTHDFHFQGESGAAFAIQCSHNPKNIVNQACDLAVGRLYKKPQDNHKSDQGSFWTKARFYLHVGFLISFISFLVFYFNLDQLIIKHF